MLVSPHTFSKTNHVGFISLTNVYFKNRHGAIGIGIPHAENRGKGYGTEAIELLLAFAFDHLGLHKVRLSVHEFNQKALNVYKKLVLFKKA